MDSKARKLVGKARKCASYCEDVGRNDRYQSALFYYTMRGLQIGAQMVAGGCHSKRLADLAPDASPGTDLYPGTCHIVHILSNNCLFPSFLLIYSCYHGVIIGFFLAKDGFKELRHRDGRWAQVPHARILAGALPWVRSQWQIYKVDTRQPKAPEKLAYLEEIVRHWTCLSFGSFHVRFSITPFHCYNGQKTNLWYSTASSTAGAAAAASARHEYELDYTFSTFCFVTLWVRNDSSSKHKESLTTW